MYILSAVVCVYCSFINIVYARIRSQFYLVAPIRILLKKSAHFCDAILSINRQSKEIVSIPPDIERTNIIPHRERAEDKYLCAHLNTDRPRRKFTDERSISSVIPSHNNTVIFSRTSYLPRISAQLLHVYTRDHFWYMRTTDDSQDYYHRMIRFIIIIHISKFNSTWMRRYTRWRTCRSNSHNRSNLINGGSGSRQSCGSWLDESDNIESAFDKESSIDRGAWQWQTVRPVIKRGGETATRIYLCIYHIYHPSIPIGWHSQATIARYITVQLETD